VGKVSGIGSDIDMGKEHKNSMESKKKKKAKLAKPSRHF
jgi:hypothetical protein